MSEASTFSPCVLIDLSACVCPAGACQSLTSVWALWQWTEGALSACSCILFKLLASGNSSLSLALQHGPRSVSHSSLSLFQRGHTAYPSFLFFPLFFHWLTEDGGWTKFVSAAWRGANPNSCNTLYILKIIKLHLFQNVLKLLLVLSCQEFPTTVSGTNAAKEYQRRKYHQSKLVKPCEWLPLEWQRRCWRVNWGCICDTVIHMLLSFCLQFLAHRSCSPSTKPRKANKPLPQGQLNDTELHTWSATHNAPAGNELYFLSFSYLLPLLNFFRRKALTDKGKLQTTREMLN